MMIIVYILKYTVSIIIIPQSVLFHPPKNSKKCLFYFYSNYPKISQFYSTIIPPPSKICKSTESEGDHDVLYNINDTFIFDFPIKKIR